MNGGHEPCPIHKSRAKLLNWNKIIDSNADLVQLVLALREQFYIAKTEGMVLRVEVHQADKEDL